MKIQTTALWQPQSINRNYLACHFTRSMICQNCQQWTSVALFPSSKFDKSYQFLAFLKMVILMFSPAHCPMMPDRTVFCMDWHYLSKHRLPAFYCWVSCPRTKNQVFQVFQARKVIMATICFSSVHFKTLVKAKHMIFESQRYIRN